MAWSRYVFFCFTYLLYLVLPLRSRRHVLYPYSSSTSRLPEGPQEPPPEDLAQRSAQVGCHSTRKIKQLWHVHILYIYIYGLPLCSGLVGANLYKLDAGRVWSIKTLHAGRDHPYPRPNPNANPNPNPLGGSRLAGAVTRLRRVFWWRFPPNNSKRPKSQP